MNTFDEFLEFVHQEIGLYVAPEDARRSFDELAGWDSVSLLALLAALERKTGHRVSIADALEAGSLAEIYGMEVAE